MRDVVAKITTDTSEKNHAHNIIIYVYEINSWKNI